MFDFIVFFLMFIPLMDIIRHMRTSTMVTKVLLTGMITSFIGSYFVYTSILAEKPMNYYELLGVPARGLTDKELKSAFKAASLKYHPDKNPDHDTTDLFIEAK